MLFNETERPNRAAAGELVSEKRRSCCWDDGGGVAPVRVARLPSEILSFPRLKMPARSVVSNGIPNSKVRYSKLASDDDGYIDLQVRRVAGGVEEDI